MSLVPLAVIAFSATAALITELLQWVFVWRTPGFQALKANLAKHAAKVEEAKVRRCCGCGLPPPCLLLPLPPPLLMLRCCCCCAYAPAMACLPGMPTFRAIAHRPSPTQSFCVADPRQEGTQTAKNVKKKEARLQTWREAAAKQVAQYNMKAGVVVSARDGSFQRVLRLACMGCTRLHAAKAMPQALLPR